MDQNTTFARWLRQRRARLDLTRQELARRASCSVSAIRKFEEGQRRPSREIALLLARGLGVEPDAEEAFVTFARTGPVAAPDGPAVPPPTNLRRGPDDALVGRDNELANLVAALGAEGERLVSLTGPAGVGKSRLARAAGLALQERFADGVFLVDAASLGEPELLWEQIARTLSLGAPEQPGFARLRAPWPTASCCSSWTISTRCSPPRRSSASSRAPALACAS